MTLIQALINCIDEYHKKEITDRKLKEICGCTFYESIGVSCCHVYSEPNAKCDKKNCPVWRKLKQADFTDERKG